MLTYYLYNNNNPFEKQHWMETERMMKQMLEEYTQWENMDGRYNFMKSK